MLAPLTKHVLPHTHLAGAYIGPLSIRGPNLCVLQTPTVNFSINFNSYLLLYWAEGEVICIYIPSPMCFAGFRSVFTATHLRVLGHHFCTGVQINGVCGECVCVCRKESVCGALPLWFHFAFVLRSLGLAKTPAVRGVTISAPIVLRCTWIRSEPLRRASRLGGGGWEEVGAAALPDMV